MSKIIKKTNNNEPAKPVRKAATSRPIRLETAGFRTVAKAWEIVMPYDDFLNLLENSENPLVEVPTRNGSVVVRLFTEPGGIRVIIPHHKIS